VEEALLEQGPEPGARHRAQGHGQAPVAGAAFGRERGDVGEGGAEAGADAGLHPQGEVDQRQTTARQQAAG